MSAPHHYVDYSTRYGDTSDRCYCTASGGRDHHEFDTPWLSEAEELALSASEREYRRVAYQVFINEAVEGWS